MIKILEEKNCNSVISARVGVMRKYAPKQYLNQVRKTDLGNQRTLLTMREKITKEVKIG